MKFSKKQMAFFALVPVLIVSNIVFAVLYMTKNVSITGGIATVGKIALYEEDGITEWTSWDMPLFTPGEWGEWDFYFMINNTGNTPVYLYWNMSYSDISWLAEFDAGDGWYSHKLTGTTKYMIRMAIDDNMTDLWNPNDCPGPESLYLDVASSINFRLNFVYRGTVFPVTDPPETFAVTISFYAEDA